MKGFVCQVHFHHQCCIVGHFWDPAFCAFHVLILSKDNQINFFFFEELMVSRLNASVELLVPLYSLKINDKFLEMACRILLKALLTTSPVSVLFLLPSSVFPSDFSLHLGLLNCLFFCPFWLFGVFSDFPRCRAVIQGEPCGLAPD